MREPSIFCGIAVSLLWPVTGSNVEIDIVALNCLLTYTNKLPPHSNDYRMIVQIFHFKFNSIY